jgi:hypothetical protein
MVPQFACCALQVVGVHDGFGGGHEFGALGVPT